MVFLALVRRMSDFIKNVRKKITLTYQHQGLSTAFTVDASIGESVSQLKKHITNGLKLFIAEASAAM